jgi:MoaA/NifB/PqqE/SkfB family radical SAM enzyme
MGRRLLKNITKYFSRFDSYIFHASGRLFKRKPKLIPKLSNLYLHYLFADVPPLRLVDIAITQNCPYSCPHCYPEAFYRYGKKVMSKGNIRSLLRQARNMGVVQFNFQGGEPTIDLDQLETIVSWSNPWAHYISLSTNGFTYDLDSLERIYAMGVDKVAISLHSGIAEEHDAFVGKKGAYESALKCAVNAKRVGLEITYAMTISKQNIDSEGVRRVFDMCIDCATILDINVAMPAGGWAGATEMLLDQKHYAVLDRINSKHTNIRRDLHRHLFRTGCLAANEMVYINLFGDVLACPFLHFSPGNIHNLSLKDCRDQMLKNPWFEKPQKNVWHARITPFLNRIFLKRLETFDCLCIGSIYQVHRTIDGINDPHSVFIYYCCDSHWIQLPTSAIST